MTDLARRIGPVARVRVAEHALDGEQEREDAVAAEEPLEIRLAWPGATAAPGLGDDADARPRLRARRRLGGARRDPRGRRRSHGVAYCTDTDLDPRAGVQRRHGDAPPRRPSTSRTGTPDSRAARRPAGCAARTASTRSLTTVRGPRWHGAAAARADVVRRLPDAPARGPATSSAHRRRPRGRAVRRRRRPARRTRGRRAAQRRRQGHRRPGPGRRRPRRGVPGGQRAGRLRAGPEGRRRRRRRTGRGGRADVASPSHLAPRGRPGAVRLHPGRAHRPLRLTAESAGDDSACSRCSCAPTRRVDERLFVPTRRGVDRCRCSFLGSSRAPPPHLRLAPGPVVPPRGHARRPGGVRRPPGRGRRGRAGRRRRGGRRHLRPRAAARRRRARWPTRPSPGCAASRAQVVLTSGNHDSAQRLGFGSRLIDAAGVFLRTDADRGRRRRCCSTTSTAPSRSTASPTSSPTALHGRGGSPGAATRPPSTEAMRRVRADLGRAPGRARSCWPTPSWPAARRASASATSASGGVSAVADRPLRRRRLHRARPPARPGQRSRETVRYSGSPLAYSFSEADHTKGSWLVDLGATASAAPSSCAAPVPRALARVSGTLDEPADRPPARRAEDALAAGDADRHRAPGRRRWSGCARGSRTTLVAAPSRRWARRAAVRSRGRAAGPPRPRDRARLRRPRCAVARRPPTEPALLLRRLRRLRRRPRRRRPRCSRRGAAMRLHRLSITAFGPFADTAHVDFDAPVRRRPVPAHGRHRRRQDQRPRRRLLRALRRGAGRPQPRQADCAPTRPPRAPSRGSRSSVTLAGRTLPRSSAPPPGSDPRSAAPAPTREQAHGAVCRADATAPGSPLTSRLDEAGDLLSRAARHEPRPVLPGRAAAPGRVPGVPARRLRSAPPLLQRLFRTGRFERVEGWLRDHRLDAASRVASPTRATVSDLVSRLSEAAGVAAPEAVRTTCPSLPVTGRSTSGRSSCSAQQRPLVRRPRPSPTGAAGAAHDAARASELAREEARARARVERRGSHPRPARRRGCRPRRSTRRGWRPRRRAEGLRPLARLVDERLRQVTEADAAARSAVADATAGGLDVDALPADRATHPGGLGADPAGSRRRAALSRLARVRSPRPRSRRTLRDDGGSLADAEAATLARSVARAGAATSHARGPRPGRAAAAEADGRPRAEHVATAPADAPRREADCTWRAAEHERPSGACRRPRASTSTSARRADRRGWPPSCSRAGWPSAPTARSAGSRTTPTPALPATGHLDARDERTRPSEGRRRAPAVEQQAPAGSRRPLSAARAARPSAATAIGAVLASGRLVGCAPRRRAVADAVERRPRGRAAELARRSRSTRRRPRRLADVRRVALGRGDSPALKHVDGRPPRSTSQAGSEPRGDHALLARARRAQRGRDDDRAQQAATPWRMVHRRRAGLEEAVARSYGPRSRPASTTRPMRSRREPVRRRAGRLADQVGTHEPGRRRLRPCWRIPAARRRWRPPSPT